MEGQHSRTVLADVTDSLLVRILDAEQLVLWRVEDQGTDQQAQHKLLHQSWLQSLASYNVLQAIGVRMVCLTRLLIVQESEGVLDGEVVGLDVHALQGAHEAGYR